MGDFYKINTGLLTLLDAATKVMQDSNEEMIKNVSNIEKCQPFSLKHDQFALANFASPIQLYIFFVFCFK